MSGSSTLPPVRLNNQAYQNVTSTVVAMSGRAEVELRHEDQWQVPCRDQQSEQGGRRQW